MQYGFGSSWCIIYNLVLARGCSHSCGSFVARARPAPEITSDPLLSLFLLAVLANVAYCAAYVPEIPAQLSGFRPQWLRFRLAVFLAGLAFAAILAHFYARAFFSPDI